MVTNSNLTRFGSTTNWNYNITSRDYSKEFFKHEHVRKYLLRTLKMYEYESSLLFSHFNFNNASSFIRLFLYDNYLYTTFFHERRPTKKRILKSFDLERFKNYKLRTRLFRTVKTVNRLINLRHKSFSGLYSFNVSMGNSIARKLNLKNSLGSRRIYRSYIAKFLRNLFYYNNLLKFNMTKIKSSTKYFKKNLSLVTKNRRCMSTRAIAQVYRPKFFGPINFKKPTKPFKVKLTKQIFSRAITKSYTKHELQKFLKYDFSKGGRKQFLDLVNPSRKFLWKLVNKKIIKFSKRNFLNNLGLSLLIIKKLQLNPTFIPIRTKRVELTLTNALIKYINIIRFFIFKTNLLKKNRTLKIFKHQIYNNLLKIVLDHCMRFAQFYSSISDEFIINKFRKVFSGLFRAIEISRIINGVNHVKVESLQLGSQEVIADKMFSKSFVDRISFLNSRRKLAREFKKRRNEYSKSIKPIILNVPSMDGSSNLKERKKHGRKPLILGVKTNFDNKNKIIIPKTQSSISEINEFNKRSFSSLVELNAANNSKIIKYDKSKENYFYNKYFEVSTIKNLVVSPFQNLIYSDLTRLLPAYKLKQKNKINFKRTSNELFRTSDLSLMELREKYSNSLLFILNRFILKYSIYTLSRDLPVIDQTLTNYAVVIYPLKSNRISHFLYTRFIIRRLAQRFSLFETLKILKRFLTIPTLRGYIIKCSGRFTKKQRASTYIVRKGSVPIGSFNTKLNYHSETIKLKYGACCIKIWISR